MQRGIKFCWNPYLEHKILTRSQVAYVVVWKRGGAPFLQIFWSQNGAPVNIVGHRWNANTEAFPRLNRSTVTLD